MPALTYTPIVVVDTTNMDESTWHDYRRKGIGGSDVAAVYGQSPFPPPVISITLRSESSLLLRRMKTG